MSTTTTLRSITAAEVNAPPEWTLRGWWEHSMVLAGRQFLIWAREPFTTAQSILMPALSMVLIKVVMGDTIGRATGVNSVYGSVPMIILVGSMFGSMATALRLNQESTAGLLSRLYVMPIHRGADLTARIVAELVRILVTTVVLLGVGYLLGFRFAEGVWTVFGLIGVAVLYGTSFSVFIIALAVNSRPGASMVHYVSLLSTVLMFFNSGFTPVDMYPEWLQPIVEYQPMSPAIDVMRGLALGDRPIAHKLVIVFIWSAIMIVLFIYPAIRGYRKAATARG
ncbi:peptide ABC transporter permease [Gordonia amarae]|uniref:Transport permease protein n=2 Tax=Gordonia amarae TaxID=36821 RepID=G7GWZ7_9ACTN|nr:ABC transporter permease [Gordonia amarae]MCS3880331.1 ABC-2 type transport system permease protein [Gordonia amarae]QHN18678.1 peptide ABC transporter permease [Gordonia amarae]QHN23153.1 peptide ABC transporter permease [Gordonia amarae]QHN32054.1 peptide ABC transporter permease [Gordonia amarae]QHN40801.1 peptide ABC transporter permease [Gordonia amarae]